MKTKDDLIEIKRRKEIQRRLRFIKGRMRNMPTEQKFAEGKLKSLPNGFELPPDWALAAARIASKAVAKPIAHLYPKEGKVPEAGDFVELLSYFQAMVGYVQSSWKELREQKRDIPELEKLRVPLSKQLFKAYHHFLKRLNKRIGSKSRSAIPSPEQLLEMNSRERKGLRAFAKPNGEMRDFDSVADDLCFVIWLFWPYLRHKFSAPYIHLWFRKELGGTTSDKTVEAVVTRLRKAARNPNLET